MVGLLPCLYFYYLLNCRCFLYVEVAGECLELHIEALEGFVRRRMSWEECGIQLLNFSGQEQSNETDVGLEWQGNHATVPTF